MARSRRSWLALLAAMLIAALALHGAGPAAALTPISPATPQADPLAGRLGGSLDDLLAERGKPDWTATGLIGYNQLNLAGQPTIVVVYYDDARIVTSLALVYLARPAAFDDARTVASVVAAVVPTDAACVADPVENAFGSEVYPCASTALASVVTADRLADLGRSGDPGSFNYSINPIRDSYFEIMIEFGTDLAGEATPTPTPEATAGVDESGLAGRLGGTRADWEQRFGRPIGEERYEAVDGTITFTLYTLPDGGEISAAYDASGRVAAISLAMSGIETADVISAFALNAVAAYGPADAVCSDTTWMPSPNDPADLSAVGIACDSAALTTPGYRPTFTTSIHFVASPGTGLDALVILKTLTN